ncbi:hypothetical protein MC885_005038 [Smutsia gigantea]|nr:hypothetical protein MC885_005038 [Smutsia gigantea]
MDSLEAPGASWKAPCGTAAPGTWTKGCLSSEEVSGSSCSLGSGPKAPSAPAGSQHAFTSSFSFIQLSLGSAGEHGEAEGCLPSREAEASRQSLEETERKAASLDQPHGHPGPLSPHFSLKVDSAQAAGGSPRLECGMPSLLDMDTASRSPDPSSFEGSSPEDTHGRETLLRRCEPALLGCLLSSQRRLEVKSLRLKLQKLQEKSVEDDDYDKVWDSLDALEQRSEHSGVDVPS